MIIFMEYIFIYMFHDLKKTWILVICLAVYSAFSNTNIPTQTCSYELNWSCCRLKLMDCNPAHPSSSCCQVTVSACRCLNGASCVADVVGGGGTYRCMCLVGFTGVKCEVNVDDCKPNPCRLGRCLDGVDSFTCICPAGTTGEGQMHLQTLKKKIILIIKLWDHSFLFQAAPAEKTLMNVPPGHVSQESAATTPWAPSPAAAVLQDTAATEPTAHVGWLQSSEVV